MLSANLGVGTLVEPQLVQHGVGQSEQFSVRQVR